MSKISELNIYALCTVAAGVDVLSILKEKIKISGLIGLKGPRDPEKISGYQDMETIAKNWELPFIGVESYGLNSDLDREQIKKTEIDLLLVVGWQRLIPPWLIEHCRLGALGGHGGPGGITACRGRSPQNWSLMLGQKSFAMSLFVIDPGIDSGSVIETIEFPLEESDDINSSYAKVTLSMADMIERVVVSGDLNNLSAGPPQNEKDARYLPQRTAEDGYIDWERSPIEICRFVRALTEPYPGARSTVEGEVYVILEARPFRYPFSSPPTAGEVIMTLNCGRFVVATQEGAIIVDKWSSSGKKSLKKGMKFNSVSFKGTIQKIASRHESKYPNLPLSPIILKQV